MNETKKIKDLRVEATVAAIKKKNEKPIVEIFEDRGSLYFKTNRDGQALERIFRECLRTIELGNITNHVIDELDRRAGKKNNIIMPS